MKRFVIYGFLILGLSNLYFLGQVVENKIYDQIHCDNVAYWDGYYAPKLAVINLKLKQLGD